MEENDNDIKEEINSINDEENNKPIMNKMNNQIFKKNVIL